MDKTTTANAINKLASGIRRATPIVGILAVALVAWVVAGPYMSAMSRPQPGGGGTERIHTSTPTGGKQVAVLAGGCFWAMQAMFQQLKGVDEVVPGFAGGHTVSPSYDEVCTHTTGHAESIRIVFDPKVISYRQLLTVFFSAHDPTTLDPQGDDEGTNYRSAIFYNSPEQKAAAEDAIAATNHALGGNVVVTQLTPLKAFYAAEEYHNNYFAQHPDEPYCAEVVAPKVEKFRDHWHAILKS